ncbi:hypothetical protein [Aliiglaciecola sp. M165]|uniref:hypothetical protein n=1 Tax=Aliiglaciecola sp. M165 TaxID=2593649 RepID=UPI00163DAE78|nr:hypothetical protein [Aliiglaciecola sp. M165]
MKLFIVYTKDEMILSKQEYESWREVQNDFCDYQTSLGPWEENEVIDYLEFDYPDLYPSASVQVNNLKASGHFEIVLSFKNSNAT